MIGRRLGRFRVTARLGQGGMATVWKAEDELLGSPVAVKVLAETLSGSPAARRRFLHEARAASLLDHPGIAAVFDAGESEGAVWLAMAYVDGETLSERILRRLLPIEESVRIVGAAAAALSHAHARGVVHRDVTPRNIMVAGDGRVVVLDFGLALVAGESRVTTSQTILGTICYLPPEVALGLVADPRSDVYGLGVVLYEALTGALPFTGDRPDAVLYGIVNQAPLPPRAHRPEIPAALERIVLRAMARQPGDRYASAEDLARDLQAFAAGGAGTPAGSGAPQPAAETGAHEPAAAATGAPVYLATLPFEDLGGPGPAAGDGQALARGLAATVAAALGRTPGLRVIPPEAGGSSEDASPRELARRLGASLLLRGNVHRAGARMRLAWSLLDPQRNVQLAGDTLDGSDLELFDLEDRLIAGVLKALGRPEAPALEPARPRPRDPAAHEHYLQALGYLQRYDSAAAVEGAIGLLERLLASESEQARVHAALARAYLYQHRLTSQRVWADRAAAACQRALALDADDPEVLVTQADLRFSAGRHAEAITGYRRALARAPDLSEALLGLARASAAAGDTAAAEEAARRTIALRRRDWRGYSMLGFVYFQEGQYARAVEPWRRAVRFAPDNARALRNLGSAYFELDRLDEAAAVFRRALEVRPTAPTYTNLGTTLFYLGRHDEAVEAFAKATALTPADPVVWGNLGCAYHCLPGRRADAVEVLERAVAMMRERLRRNPRDAEGWERLAGWLGNLGCAREAEEAMARALGLAPQDPRILAGAGILYSQAGDQTRAMHYVREAVRHGYGVGLLQRSPELAPLRDDPEFRRILRAARGPAAGREPETPKGG